MNEEDEDEDELADNPMYSTKTWEFLGNYDDTKPGIIKHFTSKSFYLWMKKADVDNFDEVEVNNELTAQFSFDDKLHQISTRRLELK